MTEAHNEKFNVHALGDILFDQLDVEPEATLLVALSGGVDSVALLSALVTLKQLHRPALEIYAAHLDHGLNHASREWVACCENVCHQLGVKLFQKRIDIAERSLGENIEAYARNQRYSWFLEVLESLDCVAYVVTAHHQNDQVETVLLSLFNGKATAGVNYIRARRPLAFNGKYEVIRPLLAFTKQALAQYAEREQLTWVHDPSNTDVSFDRNYIRQKIVPEIESRWSHSGAAITHFVEYQGQQSKLAAWAYKAHIEYHQNAALKTPLCLDIPLSIDAFNYLKDGMHGHGLLAAWCHQNRLTSPGRHKAKEFLRQIELSDENHATLMMPNYQLRRYRQHVYLVADLVKPEQARYPVTQQRDEFFTWYYDFIIDGDDHHKTPALLTLKTMHWGWRKGGERFRVNENAGSTTLKKLSQQHGLPTWVRDYVPLLYCDDLVVWAYGLGVNADYRRQVDTIAFSPRLHFMPESCDQR